MWSSEAFFRSLPAFYEEGLYEVPYIESVQSLNGFTVRPWGVYLAQVLFILFNTYNSSVVRLQAPN